APRSQGESVDVLGLIDVAPDTVLPATRLTTGAPDRLATDVARRGDVLLQECRRRAQNGGDIVKAIAGDILGQQGRDVDIQPKHCLDRARVLGPVEPVEPDAAGSGLA